MMKNFSTLLLAGFALMATVSCTKEIIDEVIEEPVPEVVTVKEPTKIHVSVGAGLPQTKSTVDYNSTTGERTLKFTDGDKLFVRCEIGDTDGKILSGFLDIVATTIAATTVGEATAATFSGELKVYGRTPSSSEYGFDYTESSYDFGGAEDVLAYCLSDGGGTKSVGSANATLVHNGSAAAFDNDGMHGNGQYAHTTAADANALMSSRLVVTGDYDATKQAFPLAAEAGQPILNCTIAGLTPSAAFNMTYSASIDNVTYRDHTSGTITTDANGTATFACFGGARLQKGSQTFYNLYHVIKLTNTTDETDVADVALGQRTLADKVYNITRRFVDLSDLSGNFTAKNGDILTGTLGGNYELSIDDGATVTLADVSINADGTGTGEYNGITCLGNATINLADGTTNTVRGMNGLYYGYSGIFVPLNETGSGDEYTLTIQGTGTLNAFGGKNAAGIGGNGRNHGGDIVIAGGTINATGGESAAGIGSGSQSSSYTISCGKITISGGTVIANGGAHAAGIGSGEYGRCGKITISGGTVVANGGANAAGIGNGEGGSCYNIYINSGTVTANGGARAAGIGNGEGGSCNEITISPEVTKVTATKGSGAPNSIGPGQNGSCNSVTIGGTQYWGIAKVYPSVEYGYKNGGDTYLTTSPLVYQP